MIKVDDIFNSVMDRINPSENGMLTNERFDRLSWLAQLSLIDWLSGDVSNIIPPQPYLTQKNKDWLSPFISKYSVSVVGGKVDKPDDYYGWDNGFIIGVPAEGEDGCSSEDGDVSLSCPVSISILNGDVYNKRCSSKIKGLKPSFTKPIGKIVGDQFEFSPYDIGSITIEYIRYPKKTKRSVVIDPVLKDEVYSESGSVHFEWPEYAHGILTWFIVDLFSNFTREQALKQFNTSTGKTPRG